eukprot:2420836-Alexandrium_andersonii.AAC.1
MPRVDGLLPRERGANWKEYLELGHDMFSKDFDPLWQPGPFDLQTSPEAAPENAADFPSYCW